MSAEFHAKSLKDVARFFGVALDTVRKNWRAAGMPGTDRAWPLDEIARWRLARLEQQQRDRPALTIAGDELSPSEALSDPKNAVDYERWRQLNLKNNVLASAMLPRDAVERNLAELLSALRDNLMTLPETIAAELPQDRRAPLQARMQTLVGLHLARLADTLAESFRADESQSAEDEP